MLWFAICGALLVRGLSGPANRIKAAQFATLASAFALSVYVAYTAPWPYNTPEAGLLAQGRYVLTFISLLLVLGGFAAERTSFSNERGMACWMMGSWVVIQVSGLALGLKRVMVGVFSSWFEPPGWTPPSGRFCPRHIRLSMFVDHRRGSCWRIHKATHGPGRPIFHIFRERRRRSSARYEREVSDSCQFPADSCQFPAE